MKRCFIRAAVAMAAAVFVMGGAAQVRAAEELPALDVSLTASVTKAAPGDTFEATLNFNNAASYERGVVTFLSIIEFRTSQLEFVKAEYDESVKGTMTSLYNGKNEGDFKVLYIDPYAGSHDAFKKNGAFVTLTFRVKEEATGNAGLSVFFDSVLTVTGSANTGVKNIALQFNQPTASVEIVSDGDVGVASQNPNPSYQKPAGGGETYTASDISLASEAGFYALNSAASSNRSPAASGSSITTTLGGNQSAPTDASDDGLSAGIIVLIVLACIVVVGGAAAVAVLLIKRKQSAPKDETGGEKN